MSVTPFEPAPTPTSDEIADACSVIRESWTEHIRESRSQYRNPPAAVPSFILPADLRDEFLEGER